MMNRKRYIETIYVIMIDLNDILVISFDIDDTLRN